MAVEGEDRLLEWLRGELGEDDLLGDDAARLAGTGERIVTVDSQIEGVHFRPGLEPEVLARRLLAVNLSDLAACGAHPAHALLALATPGGFPHRRFFRALLEACRAHAVTLAGGDLAQQPDRVAATLTLIGELPAGGRFLSRRDAAAGHGLWVGGTLGESAAGRLLIDRGADLVGGKVHLPPLPEVHHDLAPAARRAVRRHLEPEPQLALGLELGRADGPAVGAVLDVSDGLAVDLRRLCRESGVGAVVDAGALPAPPALAELAALVGVDANELVLGGGEDYVLLFTLPPGTRPPVGCSAHRIGNVTDAPELLLERAGGRTPLPELGWDHLRREG